MIYMQIETACSEWKIEQDYFFMLSKQSWKLIENRYQRGFVKVNYPRSMQSRQKYFTHTQTEKA